MIRICKRGLNYTQWISVSKICSLKNYTIKLLLLMRIVFTIEYYIKRVTKSIAMYICASVIVRLCYIFDTMRKCVREHNKNAVNRKLLMCFCLGTRNCSLVLIVKKILTKEKIRTSTSVLCAKASTTRYMLAIKS